MEPIRKRWLEAIARFQRDMDRPGGEDAWSPSLDFASADELHAIQSEKLREAVHFAYACIPFYRRKLDAIGLEPGDIRGIDDLTRIPVTTKQEMAEDVAANPPWGTYTSIDDRTWAERGWQMFASSGTTSHPRCFRYTQFDRRAWAWSDARAMWAMGFRPGRDSALLAFGYGPHVWLWGVHYALNRMGIPILTGGGLDTRTRARFIEQYRPTILCCTPSYALHLGTVMLESGIDPAATSIRFLFCAGEPGFSVPSTRERLEHLWHAELHEFYGCTEAAPAAGGYTCSAIAARKGERVATHLMADTHIWETVDADTLEPVGEGHRGLSVVTNLISEASPQLRFLVGDFTVLGSARCECGRSHPRALGGFLGRADDMLNVRGVTLFPSSVEDAIRRVSQAGNEFEIRITRERDLDVLTVRVEPAAAASDGAQSELGRAVESEIIARCELRPVVEVVAPGTLPKTEFKAKRVRDLRKGA
ncbi:MAG TPA: AMP-binding protein [Candidatus Binatia bacterium]|nr:AMP-binding protein [Candidatus Binatia bacterium]